MAQKRKSRSRRRNSRERVVKVAPAYVKREIPFYEFLNEEGLVKIEQQADWLIEHNGMEFRDDKKALQIWRDAGADVQGTRVKMPAEMVRELCKTAPSEFIQHARNPKRSVKIGGRNQVYAPVYGPPFVYDLKGGRRYGTIKDHEQLVKLCYSLDSLHHSGFITCEPSDVPVSKRHLDMLYNHIRYTDKPFLGAINEMSRAEDSVAMAKIMFGEEFMQDNCVIM
ncbi:MAG: trimethylamine--corrinoid protein Co-methyltransferase, partial [Arenicella sp.]